MSTQVLSVSLPSSTLYVSGTVNDVAYTWTNVEGDTWQATVTRSADDTYRLVLTAIDSNGRSTELVTTLYYGLLNLITDRTAADRQRVAYLAQLGWANMTQAQRSEWLTAMKGAYNAEDLNRVNGAVSYLAQAALALLDTIAAYMEEKGVAPDAAFLLPYRAEDVAISGTTVSWTEEDIPTQADLETYLQNVVTIRGLLEVASGTPELPASMAGLTVDGANAIEAALLAADAARGAMEALMKDMINRTAAAWHFSGEIYAGEVN